MSAFVADKRFQAIAPGLALIGLWWLSTALGWVDPIVLAPIGGVFDAMKDAATRHDLLDGLLASTIRFSIGALAGMGLGLTFGLLLGFFPLLERVFGPGFHAFRQIPIFAWIPLLTAWFGNGDSAKIVFIAMAALSPAAMGSFRSIRHVSNDYVELGRVLCFPNGLMLSRIVFPAALPAIIAGLEIALITAWAATIGAEYLMGGLAQGIGSFVVAARDMVRPDIVQLGIMVIAALGLCMNKLLRNSGRRASVARA